MQKILVTTDYSSNSKSGIRFAIQLAKKMSCEIVFYHVFEGIDNNNWIVDKTESDEHKIRLEKLKKFVTTIYKANHLRINKFTCVVETGIDVNNLINNYAKKNKCDFIFISTRGAGILKKLLGTTTSWLIQHSTIPLIVVPKNYRIKPIQDVWYSSDLASLKNELSIVQNFAKPFKANIHVYHYDYMIELEEVLNNLNKIAAKHITKGTFFHFRKMKIDKTISEHLQSDMSKHKPSIVVLFTKQNKTWYDKIFLRNNTSEVSFDTKTPLLILRKNAK
jgi:nucleotide-binding universal stress UspA family protein